MDIQSLGREAINRIKKEWGLPHSGFVAGGSIANIVWELVSGNKAIVNDVDVFIFDSFAKDVDLSDKNYFEFKEKDYRYYEDYSGLQCRTTYTKDFYTIIDASKEGMFNFIKYKSNTNNQSIVIKTFDINATKIGYSIEEDKIYYEPEFEEFLKTGELKVCNVITPAHTAIRIAKKSKELNAKLNKFELDLLRHSLDHGFSDRCKFRFMDRYKDMFLQHKDILQDFMIVREHHTEDWIRNAYKKNIELYSLKNLKSNDVYFERVFMDPNLQRIHNSGDFIFYMRNIYHKGELRDIWSKVYFFFDNNIEYVDKEVSKEDIELLSRLGNHAPGSIQNLKGYKLSEQIYIVKKFLEKFKEDPIVAISILEKVKVDKDMELDDQTALLLELSVRKKIVNDVRGRAKKILHNISEDEGFYSMV